MVADTGKLEAEQYLTDNSQKNPYLLSTKKRIA